MPKLLAAAGQADAPLGWERGCAERKSARPLDAIDKADPTGDLSRH